MKLKTSLLLALSASPALTQAALGPIIITPSAYEQPREESTTPITVITQQMIENSGANHVAEVLKGQAGLHVSDLFGDGSQVTVDLRGFGPTAVSNTLILIDGRPLNNSTDSGSPDLSTINIDQIKQIEILQGSAGVLYGNQAVGGVINIIRKDISDDFTQLSVSAGSFNARNVSTTIERKVGATQLSLFAKSQSSDNYREHNDSDKDHIALRLKHQKNGYDSYLEIEKTDDHLLTPGALLQSEVDISRSQSLVYYADDYFDTQTDVLRLGFNKSVSDNQSFNLDYSKRINDREFIQAFRPFAPSATPSTQDRETQIFSGKYRIDLSNQASKPEIIFGFNHEDSDYELVTSFGPQPLQQKISDFYVSGNFVSEHSQLNLGLRTSKQDAQNEGNNLDSSETVASIGITMQNNGVKSYIRADQNYRFPTVEEHTGVAFGDPVGLETQTGTSFEIGSEVNVGDDLYRITIYNIRLENEIAYDSSTFANLNLDDTNRDGLILEANNQWTNDFSSSLSITYLDAEITDGTFKGNDLPLVPTRTLRVSGHKEFNDKLSLNVELLHVNEQVLGGDFANNLVKLDSYKVVNTNLKYAAKNYSLSFKVNNLFDEEYSESGNQFTDFATFTDFASYFTSPKRNYWLTAKYNF